MEKWLPEKSGQWKENMTREAVKSRARTPGLSQVSLCHMKPQLINNNQVLGNSGHVWEGVGCNLLTDCRVTLNTTWKPQLCTLQIEHLALSFQLFLPLHSCEWASVGTVWANQWLYCPDSYFHEQQFQSLHSNLIKERCSKKYCFWYVSSSADQGKGSLQHIHCERVE